MQIERELGVSAEEFFKQIRYSVEQDIYAVTHKAVNVQQLNSGFTYEKIINNKVGKSNKVTVKIIEMREPISYKAEFISRHGVNTISYQIIVLGPKKVKVHYEESFRSDSMVKGINAKIMQWFYSFNSKKRINKLLSNIENYIIGNR